MLVARLAQSGLFARITPALRLAADGTGATLELTLVEAGSRVPHVCQRVGLVIVHAEQQRAKVRPRQPRLGPAEPWPDTARTR